MTICLNPQQNTHYLAESAFVMMYTYDYIESHNHPSRARFRSILAVYAQTVPRRVLGNGVLRAASATQGSDMVSPINRLALVYRVNLE